MGKRCAGKNPLNRRGLPICPCTTTRTASRKSLMRAKKLVPLARTCAGGYGLFISIQVRNDDKTMYTIFSRFCNPLILHVNYNNSCNINRLPKHCDSGKSESKIQHFFVWRKSYQARPALSLRRFSTRTNNSSALGFSPQRSFCNCRLFQIEARCTSPTRSHSESVPWERGRSLRRLRTCRSGCGPRGLKSRCGWP